MIKHLRGKHDQKDHGRRALGGGGARVGGVVPPGSDAESSQNTGRSNGLRRAELVLGDKPSVTELDTLRNEIRIFRETILDAHRLQKRLMRSGQPDDIVQDQEARKQRLIGQFEAMREQYNQALSTVQQQRRSASRQAARERAQNRRDEARAERERTQTQPSPDPVAPADYLAKGTVNRELSAIGPDGLPSVGRVDLGTNGIRSVQDAVRFLDEGGDLNGVPDDVLLDALKGSSRFTQGNIGTAGINGAPTLFTDTRTGRRFLSKYEDTSYLPNEDIAEVLGNNIAGRLGFPVGGVRFAGPSTDALRGGKAWGIALPDDQTRGKPLTPGRPIVMEHVDNYVTGGVRRPVSGSNARIQDSVALALLDYAILNPDRHSDNFFHAGDRTNPNLVPIDQSMGFQNKRFREADGANTRESWGDREGFRQFARTVRNGSLPNLRSSAQRMNAEQRRELEGQIAGEIRRAQDRLRAAEERAPFLSVARTATRSAGRPDPNNPAQMIPRTGADYDVAVQQQRGTERTTRNPDERLRYLMEADADDLARDMFLGL
jgi:hypothetical protein